MEPKYGLNSISKEKKTYQSWKSWKVKFKYCAKIFFTLDFLKFESSAMSLGLDKHRTYEEIDHSVFSVWWHRANSVKCYVYQSMWKVKLEIHLYLLASAWKSRNPSKTDLLVLFMPPLKPAERKEKKQKWLNYRWAVLQCLWQKMICVKSKKIERIRYSRSFYF